MLAPSGACPLPKQSVHDLQIAFPVHIPCFTLIQNEELRTTADSQVGNDR
jgi:hypothetical protein